MTGRIDKKLCIHCKNIFPATKDYFYLSTVRNTNGEPISLKLSVSCIECKKLRERKAHKNKPILATKRARARVERVLEAEGSYSDDDIKSIIKKQKSRCYYCGIELIAHFSIDHKISLRRGGSHYPHNLALCCKLCNKEKHTKTPLMFMKWRIQRGMKYNLATCKELSINPKCIRKLNIDLGDNIIRAPVLFHLSLLYNIFFEKTGMKPAQNGAFSKRFYIMDDVLKIISKETKLSVSYLKIWIISNKDDSGAITQDSWIESKLNI